MCDIAVKIPDAVMYDTKKDKKAWMLYLKNITWKESGTFKKRIKQVGDGDCTGDCQ